MRGVNVWASGTYKLLAPSRYRNKKPGRVLALNKGRWGLLDEKQAEIPRLYLAERELKFGLVLLKTETQPHVMDLDHLELASAMGSPVEVLKIVLDVFTKALGNSAHLGAHVMLETWQDKRFHAVFPDLPVKERAGVNLHSRHVQLLSEHHPAIKWRDIVDESVVKKNGLRMLGAYMSLVRYDDVRDERGRVKRFELTTDTGVVKGNTKKACLEADGFYVPCAIDWEIRVIEEQPMTFEAIEARSLCRPDLSATNAVTVLGSDSNARDLAITPNIQGRENAIPTGSDKTSRARPSRAFKDGAKRGRLQRIARHSHGTKEQLRRAVQSCVGEVFMSEFEVRPREGPRDSPWADSERPRLAVASLHHKACLDSPNAYPALVGRSVKGKVDQ